MTNRLLHLLPTVEYGELFIYIYINIYIYICIFSRAFYWGADRSLARPTSGCILFNGENTSFFANLFIHMNRTNIPPVMINRIYEHQNLLSL
jgi:hypothetical protein